MTTQWQIEPIWQGQIVAILGNSPAMTKQLSDSLRMHKRIAVNQAVMYAMDADMFVALDPHHPFWERAKDFKGMRVCGVECDLDALYAGMFYETVNLPSGAVIEIRNNFLAAIRIAVRMGVTKIILAGLDADLYDKVHAHTGFEGFAEGLGKVLAEVQAQGVQIERVGETTGTPAAVDVLPVLMKRGAVVDAPEAA